MRDADRGPLLALARKAMAGKGAAGALKRLGFTDPEQAGLILDRLREAADTGGSQRRPRGRGKKPAESSTGPPPEVLVSASVCGRPDRALRHFERFANAGGVPFTLYRRLAGSGPLCDGLLALLGHSALLSDILVRDPEYLYWLLEETPFLSRSLDRRRLGPGLRRDFDLGAPGGAGLEQLRRAQRRELLRLGASEILGLKDVARIGAELAWLADFVLETVLETVTRQLEERYGVPRDHRGRRARFCVVALGKYGGEELNFSSDVDLLFVYDGEGTAAAEGSQPIDNYEFFTRLGETLIRELTRVTVDGSLYRVDMRLRPDGLRGPLVRSMRSYWVHYETRGELWERQMLIKARRAAGSVRLWRQFRQMLVSYVYPGRLEEAPQREIRHVKQRIEAKVEKSRSPENIKLRPGGIRDIEFAVQCLQLISGGADRRARSGNTLEAIGRLRAAGTLSASEARDLRAAYRFLRRLENLLQIESDRAVYQVPDSPEARNGLAAALDLDGEDALDDEIQGHLARVRAIYDDVFFAEPAAEGEDLDWLTADPEAIEERLGGLGFDAPEPARKILAEMSSEPMMTELARRNFGAMIPGVLAGLGASPDPLQALVRLRGVISAYGAPGIFLQLLGSNAEFRRMLISICGASQYLTDLVVRDPALLDRLVTPVLSAGGAAPEGGAPDLGAAARYRNRELLRIGAEDLLGLSNPEETFLQLSDLADSMVRIAFRHAWRGCVQRRGRPRSRRGAEVGFACLAAGKYGGRELNFGSDLDLFFVYGAAGQTGRSVDNNEFFSELAQVFMQTLKEMSYEVDARLRPEGRRAPIAIDLAGYRRYLKTRAIDWERLALSRSRPVAGDPDLCGKVQRAIGTFLFRDPVDGDRFERLVDIHGRLKESVPPGSVDIKRGRGGITDIEFIAQILLITHGKTTPGLGVSGTRPRLVRLLESGLIGREDGQVLLPAYDRFREVEKGFRMMGNRPITALPGGAELERLARTLGAADGKALEEELKQLMSDTRKVFERFVAAGKAEPFSERKGG